MKEYNYKKVEDNLKTAYGSIHYFRSRDSSGVCTIEITFKTGSDGLEQSVFFHSSELGAFYEQAAKDFADCLNKCVDNSCSLEK